MTDEKPRKRSEELAIENVKRIADVLRSERNDAIALAQIKREEADTYKALLKRAVGVLRQAAGGDTAIAPQLDALIKDIPAGVL